MRSRIRIGRLCGIELDVDYSWFFTLFLMTFSLFVGYRRAHPWWPLDVDVYLALASAMLFFTSIAFHEASHAWVAARRGVRVGSVTLYAFGGMLLLKDQVSSPATEFLIAIAGPAASLFVGAGCLVVAALTMYDPGLTYITAMMTWLFLANILLALFNLIPAYPMDGGRILRSCLWALSGDMTAGTRFAATAGVCFSILMLSNGISLMARSNTLQGLWNVILGAYLLQAAWMAIRQTYPSVVRIRQGLL